MLLGLFAGQCKASGTCCIGPVCRNLGRTHPQSVFCSRGAEMTESLWVMKSWPDVGPGRRRRIEPDLGPLPGPRHLVMWSEGVGYSQRLLPKEQFKGGCWVMIVMLIFL